MFNGIEFRVDSSDKINEGDQYDQCVQVNITYNGTRWLSRLNRNTPLPSASG